MASLNSLGVRQPMVLVVEDDPGVRRLMETVLTKCDLHVLSAADGRTALELCQMAGLPIDLLIADLGLPMLNGYDLAQRLKPAHPDMAVLFTSGYLEGDLIERCKLDVDSNFLPKPFSPAELDATVHAALNGRRGVRPGTRQCVPFAPAFAVATTFTA